MNVENVKSATINHDKTGDDWHGPECGQERGGRKYGQKRAMSVSRNRKERG